MLKTNNDVLVAALSEALETMAFMVALPPEDEMMPPIGGMRAQMTFAGPLSGTIEVVAGQEFRQLLAANVLGLDEGDPEAVRKGIDALQEIVNTTCGILLPQFATPESDVFEVSLPQAQPFDDEQWAQFLEQGATVLDVEGCAVAARLVTQ